MGFLAKLKSNLIVGYLQYVKGVEFPTGPATFIGLPLVQRAPGSRIIIGAHTTIVSDTKSNVAGINHRTILATVCPGSKILIGAGGGISGATIVAAISIEIDSYVGLGVNACVYDTDFHTEDPDRRGLPNDLCTAQKSPVRIGKRAWVGGNVIILKGVHIGDCAIIGAGSVVTRDVPAETIYAGNPAKFIRQIRRQLSEIAIDALPNSE